MASSENGDNSSGGDIPSRKQLAKEKQTAQDPAEEEEDDEDMDADEYVVEKVMKHKFDKDGTLFLDIKWQGYDLADNTWEPLENLDGAPDEVATYFRAIGGKPVFQPKESKKRKASMPAVDTPSPANGGRGRGAKKAKAEVASRFAGDGAEFKAPEGSWEEAVNSIDTMERGEDGKLYAFVLFKNGKRARYSNDVVNRKCPQRMLEFYEEHLYIPPTHTSPDQRRLIEHGRQFNTTTTAQETTAAAATVEAPVVEDPPAEENVAGGAGLVERSKNLPDTPPVEPETAVSVEGLG